MDSQQLQLVKMKATSFARTLGTASQGDKSKHLSHQMADNFNGLVSDLEKIAPDSCKSNIPNIITKDARMIRLGLSSTTFLEVEIYIAQILDLISMMENED